MNTQSVQAFDAEINRDKDCKLKLGAKQNRKKCGKKFVPEPVKKGLLLCALRAWESKHGIGLCPITRNAAIQYWPKRKVA